jgi:hypothetical protein
MGIMVFCNSQILIKQAALTDEHQEPEEYWLLRFPFSLHAGWTLAVFVMCINGLITFLEWGAGIRLTFGFLSLIAFIAMSWKMLFANGPKPNYAIPAILSWVCVSINISLFLSCNTACDTFVLTRMNHINLSIKNFSSELHLTLNL